MRKVMRWKFMVIPCCLVMILSCKDKRVCSVNESTSNNIRENKIDSAEESFQYFEYKQLVEEFPFNNTNPSSYFREFVKANINKASKLKYRSLPSWESIGPSNIAGRTLCLAINPQDTNQLWMGSAGSGLWKSNKGGIGANAWQYVSTGYPVISVSSIAIQVDQPNNMYIGTGEIYNYDGSDGGIHTRTLRGSKGIGILKSVDGGIHWSVSLDWTTNNQTSVWKIIIHPKNPTILFAATNQGIYKSMDGGNNWENSLSLPLALDLIINPIEPNILYAGVGGINGKQYGVYKTIDEGLNWNLVSTPNDTIYNGRIMLANYKANPKRVYAAFSDNFKTIALMRSRNGFDSSNFYLPIKDVCEHQGWYAKCLHVKDDDSSKLIMGGVDLYLDTTGTGNQLFNLLYWKVKIHADMHDIISNPLDPNKIYVATDGGLYRSNNFAQSFSACNQGYLSSQFYTGSVTANSSFLLGGLQDNKSALYTNTIDWRSIHQADGTFNAFNPVNDSIFYVSSQYQNLYLSNDFGLNWKELVKANLNASFVSPFLIHSQNHSRIYSGGNQLLISNDTGKSWDTSYLSTNDEFIVAMEADVQNADKIYLSTLNLKSKESHLYYSQDGGHHLELKEVGIPERFIRDIAIDPKNSNTLYLALGGSGQAGIMKSENAAASWSFPENNDLPDVPFHTILIDPIDNNIIYAGCDFGLYVSVDRGKNWISYNIHPYDLVAVYDIKYSSFENKLILFTHGFGAFRCSLLDKSIITKTTSFDNSKRIFNLINEYIELPDTLNMIRKIFLVNLEGKNFQLSKNGRVFSTKSLASGVYYFISDNPALHGVRIIIVH